jgi:hypothetical protein
LRRGGTPKPVRGYLAFAWSARPCAEPTSKGPFVVPIPAPRASRETCRIETFNDRSVNGVAAVSPPIRSADEGTVRCRVLNSPSTSARFWRIAAQRDAAKRVPASSASSRAGARVRRLWVDARPACLPRHLPIPGEKHHCWPSARILVTVPQSTSSRTGIAPRTGRELRAPFLSCAACAGVQ